MTNLLTTTRFFCINLNRRTDRWSSVTAQFRQLGISVQRFSALSDLPLRPGTLHQGEQGLIASNLTIFRGLVVPTTVGIFEDDVHFLMDRMPHRTMAALSSELPDSFGLLYLGAHLFDEKIRHMQVSPHLIRLLPESEPTPTKDHVLLGGTHAIIFSKAVVEYIRYLPDEILFAAQWDIFLSKYIVPKFNCFLAHPAFAFQIEDYSDLQSSSTKRNTIIMDNERKILRGAYSPTTVGRLMASISGATARQRSIQRDSDISTKWVPGGAKAMDER